MSQYKATKYPGNMISGIVLIASLAILFTPCVFAQTEAATGPDRLAVVWTRGDPEVAN